MRSMKHWHWQSGSVDSKTINSRGNTKAINRSNKLNQALELPVICNLNPRSIYNKVDEFHTFVTEYEVDAIFMSESWERENKSLSEIINLDNYQVISNVNQRKEKGGRPPMIVNSSKYNVTNLTNSLISVKWGVEAVWCLLAPKDVHQDSNIQHIACAAIYCKPNSKHKTDLLDHIAEAYHVLNSKYGRGLHFIIAGDTNQLKLNSIFDLNKSFVQLVQKATRIDPTSGIESILDPIITSLSAFYQEPLYLEPLDVDSDKHGKKSDHRIIVVKPINSINNKCARTTRIIRNRPITQSAIQNMLTWLIEEDWNSVYSVESAHDKAEEFQNKLMTSYKKYFPEKVSKFSNDDQPWMTDKLKKVDRHRKRMFNKHRKSENGLF